LVTPVAIDTSVLIAAEKLEAGLSPLLPPEENIYYIPALAAAEFMVGFHPPVRKELRDRALALYRRDLRDLVSPFSEADAAQLASLISELKSKGQQMKFFDAGIAATALARGDKLLVIDSDFDRLQDRIVLLRPSPSRT
jgi:predicted nucleic acid-binding protein